MKNILVTGGCGFIGSNFIKTCLENYSNIRLVNLDKLTYAGNLANLADLEHDTYRFVHGDICDQSLVERLFSEENIEPNVHFSDESQFPILSFFMSVPMKSMVHWEKQACLKKQLLMTPAHLILPARHHRITW